VRTELTAADLPTEFRELTAGPTWDADRFVDLCSSACNGRNDLAPTCRLIQRREWETLFDFCFSAAVGER